MSRNYEVMVSVVVETTYAIPVEAVDEQHAVEQVEALLENGDASEIPGARQVSDYPMWVQDEIGEVTPV